MRYLFALIAIMFVFNILCVKLALDHAINSNRYEKAYEASRSYAEGLMRTRGVVDNAFNCKRK